LKRRENTERERERERENTLGKFKNKRARGVSIIFKFSPLYEEESERSKRRRQ
jgi:hypothetical protein